MSNVPGQTAQPDQVTRDYVLNHVMLRVRDPRESLDFYTRILGLALLRKQDVPAAKFTLYFLGYVPEGVTVPGDEPARSKYVFGREAVLELTHNWGTEDSARTPYHSGNAEPRGFGHICISVPDVAAACARFDRLNVPFQKRLGEGGMKNIAFIKDPDGYWIEVVQPGLS